MAQTKSGNGSSYPAVRRRISKACNYCRQRKIKCNGNSPCANCKNHSVECTYTKTVRKKKRKPVKKLTLQELEKRVLKMDEKFDLMNQKLGKVIAILSQNRLLGDKSLTHEYPSNASEASDDVISEDFSEDEYEDSRVASDDEEEEDDDPQDDQQEEEEEQLEEEKVIEKTSPYPISPITSSRSLNDTQPPRLSITRHTLKQTNSASSILTPPDDEFQFMTNDAQYPLSNNLINVDQYQPFESALSSHESAMMDSADMGTLNEQMNMMESKMMLSFDTVGHLSNQLDTVDGMSVNMMNFR